MNAAKIELNGIADIKGFLGTGNYSHRVVTAERSPTSSDYDFYLGTLWIANKLDVWILIKVENQIATWYRIVTPEFSDIYEVVANIMQIFEETQKKAQDAMDTANEVKRAKDEGELDGFNPVVQLTSQENGVMFSITDATHTESELIPKGDKGPAGTIEIGTITTGPAGSEAKVSNVGTPESAVLEITIPRGAQGMGLTISGKYNSYEEFKAEHPTGVEGENWQVTTEEGDVIYTWNELIQDWQSLGQLRGATGPHYTPNVQEGILKWSNTEGLENPPDYDLLQDLKDFVLEQGYADGEEIQRLINNTLYQAIQDAY